MVVNISSHKRMKKRMERGEVENAAEEEEEVRWWWWW
jgi:hypothetical protein